VLKNTIAATLWNAITRRKKTSLRHGGDNSKTPWNRFRGKKLKSRRCAEGDTVGMHLVMFDSTNDTILFTHDAKSRLGFAEGAVRAARMAQRKDRVTSSLKLWTTL